MDVCAWSALGNGRESYGSMEAATVCNQRVGGEPHDLECGLLRAAGHVSEPPFTET